MNRILIALLLCLAATPPSPTANVKPRVSLQPSLRYGFGETEYVLDARWYDDEGVLQHLKSQLEFPLDGLYAGLEGRVRWNPASTKPWDSKLSVSTNLSDPAGDMTDRDWSTFWESGSETFYLPSFTELSSTVSSAESRSWVVAAEVGKVLAAGPKGSIRLFAGYRYQHIAQKAIGISGWQMVNVGGELVKGYFDGSRDGTTFIDYEVTFHSPQAGLGLSLAVTDRAAVAARAAYAPVFASDRDDHVVRNFLSEASINGHGVIGEAEVEWELGRGDSWGLFLSAGGEFLYFSASGTGTQFYYGDDPGTRNEDETGQYAAGVPHEIHTTQGRVGLGLALRF